MTRALILYATTEGHTARIVERIAQRLQVQGHAVDVRRADAGPPALDPAQYDGVIIGASIHYGRHSRHLRTLVRGFRAALAARPGAFFSVSLSAGGPGAKPETARRHLETFLRQVGWRPQQIATFAGALQYSKYGVFKRLLMRLIVGVAGGDSNPARDHEYTEWDAVERFADAFAQRLKRA
jgi:menaquinone-dependent protoporphyrinogen oxidase